MDGIPPELRKAPRSLRPEKKKEKLHLLNGLKKILLDIDYAIKLIRETDEESEVVPNLMIGFGIDEVQAEYVAEIKLRHINREYILKRTQETADLEKEIADMEDILGNENRVNKLIIDELREISKNTVSPAARCSSTTWRNPRTLRRSR